MREANRSYEANLQVIRQAREMISHDDRSAEERMNLYAIARHHAGRHPDCGRQRSGAASSGQPAAVGEAGGVDFAGHAGADDRATGWCHAHERGSSDRRHARAKASVQQVVDAVMSAEQTLQRAIAIRDKVVSAYLEISRMSDLKDVIVRSLAIAATGMNAQQTNVEVIANNIANINTTGFKRSRAEFTDLLYQTERAAGTPNRGGQEPVPEGAQIGLGVRTTAIRNLHMQGALANTGNKLDLALNGRGWFQVAGANSETVLYARRRLQQERHRPDRHRRRLRRAAGDDHPAERHRGHRQRDRPGLSCAPAPTPPCSCSASSPSPTSPTRRASIRSAAISIARPRPPARR